MLFGGDDISTLGMCFSVFIYIRARFRFAQIGGNLTAQGKFQRRSCQLSFFFLPCRQSDKESFLAG